MGDIVLFVSGENPQQKLNDTMKGEMQALATKLGIPVQETFARVREGLRRIRADEIQISSLVKIIPKNLEDINLSGIILKQTQEVSQRALMMYHTL